jgi:hypothetical protein
VSGTQAKNCVSFSEDIVSKSGGLRFDRNMDEGAINMLIRYSLLERFPAECEAWNQRKEGTRKALQREENMIKENLIHSSEELQNILREAIVDEIVKIFPYVSLEAFYVGKYSNMII